MDSFNPFGLFDKLWTKKALPLVLTTILGVLFLTSLLEVIFPAFHHSLQGSNIYTLGILTILLISVPLAFYWLSKLTEIPKERHVVMRATEDEAIRSLLFSETPRRHPSIEICCYTGPTFLSALDNLLPQAGSFAEARILIRHPACDFCVPADAARAELMRSRIRANITRFREIFAPISEKFEIRGYSGEPSLRSMTVGHERGFLGLYTMGDREIESRSTRDYVSRRKPVFEFGRESVVGHSLLDLTEARFADMWSLAARIYPKPALIFDFDGTLYHSIELHTKAWQVALDEVGVSSDDARRRTVLEGVDRGFSANQILAEIHIRGASPEMLIQRKREIYERIIDKEGGEVENLVESVITTLSRRGYRLGIASIATRSVVEKVLGRSGIRECFESVVCREDLDRAKPDPEAILRVCGALGVHPREAMMIGDSYADQVASAAAGICFVLVARRHVEANLHAKAGTAPFQVFNSLERMLELCLPL